MPNIEITAHVIRRGPSERYGEDHDLVKTQVAYKTIADPTPGAAINGFAVHLKFPMVSPSGFKFEAQGLIVYRGAWKYLYAQEPLEATGQSGPRPPWAVLAEGTRFVPGWIVDDVGTWQANGAEPDYADPTFRVIEEAAGAISF